MTRARPAVPKGTPPAGHTWAPQQADPTFWRYQPDEPCRDGRTSVRKLGACPAMAVVACFKPDQNGNDAWWTYCVTHAYGRWVEAGVVMEWRLTRVRGDAA